jgi:outer membrane lipoprotein carrier protein
MALAAGCVLMLAATLARAGVPSKAPGAPIKGDAVDAARALGARLAAVRGLTARFTQTLDAASLPSPQVEEGTLYLLRPGRMRWEYSRPAGKLAIADGVRSWLYLPEDRQALSTPLAGGADPGVTLLMRDSPDLNAEFEPSWSRERGADDRPVLALKPRAADAPYDRILVETDASGFPVALTLVDPLGGRVAYRFSGLRFVDTLDPALFRFMPPPGVSVQEIGR